VKRPCRSLFPLRLPLFPEMTRCAFPYARHGCEAAPMTWFKVDDRFYSHPKVLATSLAARGLWVSAGAWSSDQHTAGIVSDQALAMLGGTPELAAELVAAGLWKRSKGGHRFHDWASYQPDAIAEKESKAIAGAIGNHRKWHENRGIVKPGCAYCQQEHPDRKPSQVRSARDGSANRPGPGPDPHPDDPVTHLPVPDARAIRDDDDELVAVVVAEVRKREGRDVDRETARKAIARALRRRKDGPPASRVKWLRRVFADEADLYADLLLEPAPPMPDVLDGFGRAPAPGQHAYDPDPAAPGFCRCGLPEDNQSYHLEAV
jgi:hypothetical protein